MGDFISHEPCPNCGSRDNLGVWEDHKWCFGCGYYEGNRDKSIEQLRRLVRTYHSNKNKKKGAVESVTLPFDITYSLPNAAKEWLSKYEITQKEIITNHLCWSPSHERLYFPVFDLYGNLVMYQGRFFGESPKAPRYSTKGQVDNVIHIIGLGSDVLVLVEDFISAIKVGRQFPAMPLWGSQISTERMMILGDRFKRALFWLDRDKAAYSLKRSLCAATFFQFVSSIVSNKDPKEYSNGEIYSYISDKLKAAGN